MRFLLAIGIGLTAGLQMSPLHHLRPGRSTTFSRAEPPRLSADALAEVVVARTPEGSLGLLVDQDNVVVEVSAQPELRPGDVIMAVNGEPLNGRAIGQVLAKDATQYTFSISRPAADEAAGSLERVLIQLARDGSAQQPGLLSTAGEDVADGVAERCSNIVAELEGSGLAPTPEALEAALTDGAFWKLILTSDGRLAKAGDTGYGLAPNCEVLCSYQLFKPRDAKSPTAQIVEVVANGNMGSSTTAALKGDWQVESLMSMEQLQGGGGQGGAVTRVRESYERTEYDGAPQVDAPYVVNEWPCTYLSKTIRVCRPIKTAPASEEEEEETRSGEAAAEQEEDVWRIYERVESGKAQDDIGRTLSRPVSRAEEVPIWARERASYGPPGGEPMTGGAMM